jgi:hypothetical protein
MVTVACPRGITNAARSTVTVTDALGLGLVLAAVALVHPVAAGVRGLALLVGVHVTERLVVARARGSAVGVHVTACAALGRARGSVTGVHVTACAALGRGRVLAVFATVTAMPPGWPPMIGRSAAIARGLACAPAEPVPAFSGVIVTERDVFGLERFTAVGVHVALTLVDSVSRAMASKIITW